MIIKACWKDWDKIPAETKNRFEELCDKHDWTPMVYQVDSGYELLFMSPYPEIEWRVFGADPIECIGKAVRQ